MCNFFAKFKINMSVGYLNAFSFKNSMFELSFNFKQIDAK